MRSAMAYEWVRMRTISTTWWLGAMTLLVTPLMCAAFAALILRMVSHGQAIAASEALTVLLTKSPFGLLAAGLLGVLSTGNEYRHRTIPTTLLVTPRRGTAVAAKGMLIGLAGVVIAVANLAASWVVVLMMLPGRIAIEAPFFPVGRAQIGEVALVAGWGLIGVALGILVRSQTVAIVLLLALPYVLEPLARLSLGSSPYGWIARLVDYLPFAAGTAMTSVSAATPSGLTDAGSRLPPLGGAISFFVFVVALLGLAAVLFERRDA